MQVTCINILDAKRKIIGITLFNANDLHFCPANRYMIPVVNRNHALKLLEQSPHRLTRTRRLILDAVLKLKPPFSVHDVVEALPRKASRPVVDAVTVYRNLPVLEQVGILCRSGFSDDMTRFMLSGPGHDRHHHHIMCRECNRIETLDFCVLQGQESILHKMGFHEVQHRLEFTGICRNCR